MRTDGIHCGKVVAQLAVQAARSAVPRMLVGLLPGLLIALCVGDVAAQQPASSLFGNETRMEATRAIPLQQLPERFRPNVTKIVSKPTIYRRLPKQTINCDRDMYAFLIRYPEIVVNIWQLMDVTKVQLTRISPVAFDASDGAGTTTRVELIYSTPNTQVFYLEGFYQGPLFGSRVTGRGVMLFRSSYARQAAGDQISSTLDVFVRLDNVGAELVAKTLQPLVGKAADFNFHETAKFVGQMSLATGTNGPGMQRLASNLTNVDPTVRQAFVQLTDIVYQRAILRGASGARSEGSYAPSSIVAETDGQPTSAQGMRPTTGLRTGPTSRR